MISTGQDYEALRQAGVSPRRAGVELGFAPGEVKRLERAFRMKSVADAQMPRFALHDRYVAAVMKLGGFCAFSERRRGRDGAVICLPLLWP